MDNRFHISWVVALTGAIACLGCGESRHGGGDVQATGAPWKHTSSSLPKVEVPVGKDLAQAVLRFRREVWYQPNLEVGEDGPWTNVTTTERDGFTRRRYSFFGTEGKREAVLLAFADALEQMDHGSLVSILDSTDPGAPDSLFDAMVDAAGIPEEDDAEQIRLFCVSIRVFVYKSPGAKPLCDVVVSIVRDSEDRKSLVRSGGRKEIGDALREMVAKRAGGTFDVGGKGISVSVVELPKTSDEEGAPLERASTRAGVFYGKWLGSGIQFNAAWLGCVEYSEPRMCLVKGHEYYGQWLLERRTLDRVKLWWDNRKE